MTLTPDLLYSLLIILSLPSSFLRVLVCWSWPFESGNFFFGDEKVKNVL